MPTELVLSALRFAGGGEFAPVEVEVGQEEIAAAEEEEGEGEGVVRHVEEGGDGIKDAGEDEVEGEDVGANHPLAVDLDLAVAGGEESSEGAEEPEGCGNSVGEEEAGAAVVLQDECSGSRDGDGDDVDTAHDAVPFKVSLAEAGGEEEWTEDGREDSGDDVRDEEDDVLDELGAVVAGLIEERKIGEDKDGDTGESEDSPNQWLGYAPRGFGMRERGRHGCARREIRLGLRRVFGSLVSSVAMLFQMNTH
jgi:hypothetical protein